MFVPDGPLHLVPFAALIDSRTNRYVIESHAVAIVPSLALAVAAPRSERAQISVAPTALVFGNPGSPVPGRASLVNLPDAETEATDIAALYPGAKLFTGESATRSRFFEEVGRYQVLHFAGHAIQNPEYPWLSRLVVAGGSEGL